MPRRLQELKTPEAAFGLTSGAGGQSPGRVWSWLLWSLMPCAACCCIKWDHEFIVRTSRQSNFVRRPSALAAMWSIERSPRQWFSGDMYVWIRSFYSILLIWCMFYWTWLILLCELVHFTIDLGFWQEWVKQSWQSRFWTLTSSALPTGAKRISSCWCW